MRKNTLQFASLSISSIALLYLLFASLYRETFMFSDWLVVFVDLFVKILIEIYILVDKKDG